MKDTLTCYVVERLVTCFVPMAGRVYLFLLKDAATRLLIEIEDPIILKERLFAVFLVLAWLKLARRSGLLMFFFIA